MTAESILLNSFTGFFYVLGDHFVGIMAFFIFLAVFVSAYNFMFNELD